LAWCGWARHGKARQGNHLLKKGNAMASLNKVMLIGNLGGDPEVRATQSGQQVATLNVATSESWKDSSGAKQERTEWTRVVFWGRLAEVAGQYLEKGSKVYVEGSLTTRKYTDKAGVERYATEVKGRDLVMLGGKAGGNPGRQAPAQVDADDGFNDDIPF
jgi:single-strand DNA-binding protein